MHAAVVCWSRTGNTEKVARTIEHALRAKDVDVTCHRVEDAADPIFCTYSGPHTGIDEAVPAAQYAGQFFAHVGLRMVDEWYVVGEFHGSLENSTQGRLGDIHGRPDEEDLQQIERDTHSLLEQIPMLAA